ncbi:putative quinol monooxygenase [Aliiroseovarius lamellibrachiae]|uniref:putative quinol monooxygenase n=1 Tax=Aliiroseovarius lamellibrachiae TaxID=1924933 RepID=UPI001BE0B8A5|nr:putative quinol monooxygenase [Aliiroseovarius lamellibrachiae]MBT2132070.1 antibiotic biosynthesis monooxygenase [Aliiroseovarius lamellibrachiae]
MTQDPKISLIGYIDVPADRYDAVAAALPRHIELTRQEPGCLSFDVTPDSTLSGRFNVSEMFTDRIAFEAHQTRMKASRWAEITQGIPRDYSITEIPHTIDNKAT